VLLMIESSAASRTRPAYRPACATRAKDGPIDFDFMIGSFLEAPQPLFITFGMTFRY
jgi:hypothetical protein